VVADHPLCAGRRQRVTDTAHLAGVAGASGAVRSEAAAPTQPSVLPAEPALLRPLAEYELAAGGGW
jgi:hypothetical protein